ncbi:MAG: hypothetical protein KDB74_01580 [Flavobacteriales bacterium]|nr:hypothetical protein [Flavobacteriales bacterium]
MSELYKDVIFEYVHEVPSGPYNGSYMLKKANSQALGFLYVNSAQVVLMMRQGYLDRNKKLYSGSKNWWDKVDPSQHICTKGSTPILGHWICRECGENMEEVCSSLKI